jgi:NADH-quinone oxidoreductase subunit M
MLWMLQRVVLGEPSEAVKGIKDMTGLEFAALAPLVALTVIVGIWWSSILQYVDPVVQKLVMLVSGAT